MVRGDSPVVDICKKAINLAVDCRISGIARSMYSIKQLYPEEIRTDQIELAEGIG